MRFTVQPKIKGEIYRMMWLWLIYLFLALLLTWPMAGQLATHLPGDGGDDPAIAWNLWWVKYALLNQGQNPFKTDFLFYPIGINLSFYTLTFLNAVTALPLLLNWGVVTASNLHLLFTFIIGGYGGFLLVRYVLTSLSPPHKAAHIDQLPASNTLYWISAAIAGSFYAFASNKLFYVALGQFNIASSHWIPFAVLYLLRAHHRPDRLKNSFMAGLFLTFQAWAEMTYASFLLVLIALYWLYWGVSFGFQYLRGRLRLSSLSNINLYLRAGLILGITSAIGLTPILAQMLPDLLAEGDFLVEGSGFAEAFSADLFGFIVPTMHHPWLGHLIERTGISGFDKGQHIYLGFTLLGLTLTSLLTGYRYPQLRFWFVAAVVFALFCLGPTIIVNGYITRFDGPFILLQHLPFFKGNRYPSRYSVMLLLSLSVIAGVGLIKIGQGMTQLTSSFKSVKSSILLLLIAGLFFVEHLSLPLPQSNMRLPAPYQIIAATPGDFAVLDIPFAWRNGFRITGALTTQFMFGQFYQTMHQKRLLQGNTSRNPLFKFQYFTNAPVINSLLTLETGKALPPERWAQDRAIAADVLRFFNINYIVVRPEPDTSPATPQAAIPYIEDILPVKKVHDEASIKIYQVAQLPNLPSGLRLDSSHPLAPLYFAEGWGLLSPGQPIIAQRQEARLLIPLTVTPHRITFRLRLPEAAANPSSVYLKLHNWRSQPQPIYRNWQELSFEIPATVIQPGLNDIRLHFETITPTSFPAPDTPLLDVTVLSAGEEVGGFGYIFVNGHQVSPNKRGYNIVVIQPGGEILADHFDTHNDPAASSALSHYEPITLRNSRTIIAAAVADEASAQLDTAAASVLQSLGAKGDLRDCFRCSHAIISEVGQPDGRIWEALDPLRPVGITTHLGLTEPAIAASLDWIQIEPD